MKNCSRLSISIQMYIWSKQEAPRHSWIYARRHNCTAASEWWDSSRFVSRHTHETTFTSICKNHYHFTWLAWAQRLSSEIYRCLRLSGSAPSPRPATPCWAWAKQQLTETDFQKHSSVSAGPLTGDHIDLCSADIRLMLTLLIHIRVKPRKRIYFRINVFHLHGAKITVLQPNRPELNMTVWSCRYVFS